MRLFEEIAARLGLDEEVVAGEKYVVFPGRCACFEGVKAIRSFSAGAVELAFRGGVVRAEGEGFKVGQYIGGDLVLLGNVVRLEVIE